MNVRLPCMLLIRKSSHQSRWRNRRTAESKRRARRPVPGSRCSSSSSGSSCCWRFVVVADVVVADWSVAYGWESRDNIKHERVADKSKNKSDQIRRQYRVLDYDRTVRVRRRRNHRHRTISGRWRHIWRHYDDDDDVTAAEAENAVSNNDSVTVAIIVIVGMLVYCQ